MASPIIDPETKIDFYAGNDLAFQSLVPLWSSLDGRRGTFYVSHQVHYPSGKGFARLYNKFSGYNPVVVTSYHDLHFIFSNLDSHPVIMLERGHQEEHRGLLRAVTLFLCDNEKTEQERLEVTKNVRRFSSHDDLMAKLLQFVKSSDVTFIECLNGKSVGIVYMSFGDKALHGVEKSIFSLRRTGYSYPVAIIGDVCQHNTFLSNCQFIRWQGQSPFDARQKRNFQFRAGRIKPSLCKLSPFDYTLYIDADTEYLQSIQGGFEYLESFDMCIAQEKQTLAQLYNKALAGWEINIKERDITVSELGQGSENRRFINSGVIFFRKNENTLKTFDSWATEWQRFQQWDEQLALMRAISKNDAQVKYLGIDWNHPHKVPSAVIFHNYGRGVVRSNV